MFSQLFGRYLVDEGYITYDELRDTLEEQSSTKVRLGTIAITQGYMTESEADEINRIQTQADRRFGDIAVEKGYLTESEVSELLDLQGSPFMQFIQILFEKKLITPAQLDDNLENFKNVRGFSSSEMEALKCDDVDGIIPLFAFSAKPYVTDLVALVLRNITRFVTQDFYIGSIRHISNLKYSNIVAQKTRGSHIIYMGFASENSDDGLIALASDFAKESYGKMNNYVYDSLSELVNMCLGLFVTSISKGAFFVDIEPPFIFSNQECTGDGYVIPIYIHDKEVNLFISVDSSITMGRDPYVLDIEKQAGSVAKSNAKGRIMIVDDSALIRRVLRGIVEEAGYCVVCEAVDGQEAIELYKKYTPDVVTMDITMPVMDGVTALKAIRSFDHNANVVMVTSAGQQKKVIEAIKSGAYQFCMKPLDKKEVLKSLDEVFKD